ncbi:uracil-DNA glycosylase [Maricaulis sp. MIT060901]|uniref:uracil-DNA glycosylase n=1 Tax=Maricaulis sp. MIT060901 TaxID=3096993 RepID=UPI00399C1110
MLEPATLTPHDEKALQALIDWWDEAGIELDAPVTRLKKQASPAPAPRSAPTRQPPPPQRTATPAAAIAAGFGEPEVQGPSAQEVAAKADTLDALESAIREFEGCPLKRTARNTVFARGNRDAKIMIIGEAPGRDEDEQAKPFMGPAGHLLDKMFASIGLGEDALYISNIVNWRPPGNRNSTKDEIATCLPLIERHIALKAPEILVVAGGVAAQSLLREDASISRLRGQWRDYSLKNPDGSDSGTSIPCLPLFHPSFLLRQPASKKKAWHDLLALDARLR